MANSKKAQKKNKGLKRYTPIGLWVSGVALLVTIILAVVKLLTVTKLIQSMNDRWLNLGLVSTAGFTFIGLALFALFDPNRVREFLEGRQARYGSNATILLLAFIGIVVVVNIIVFQNPGKPIDMTEEKQHTLTTETLDVLKALPEPVHATAFFSSQYPADTATELLKNYKTASNGNFDYQFVDPNQNPVAAKEAGISGDGKIYLQMGEQHEIVAYASEQDLTNALIRLMNPGTRAIYFLTGHGERSLDASDQTGYQNAKTALEAKNYSVSTLNLLSENNIPTDAKVIVIAGATNPISTNEMALFQEYIAKGGAIIILEEPLPLTNIGNNPDPLSDYLAKNLGITLNNDIVLDTTSPQANIAVGATYGSHPITQKLAGLVSFFPTARSLTINGTATTSVKELVATSQASWGETDFTNQSASFDPEKDFEGPLTLAAAGTDSNTNARLVVFGDADFASDAAFQEYANGDLFINSVDWAAGEERMINLSSPQPITRTLNAPKTSTLVLLGFSMICLIPGLIVGGGITSWLIRKKRG